MSAEPVDLAEVEIVPTRMTMRVGDVSFELEWKANRLSAPLGCAGQWRVQTSGESFEAWRPTVEDARALVLEVAPVLARLRFSREQTRDLLTELHDLEETTDATS